MCGFRNIWKTPNSDFRTKSVNVKFRMEREYTEYHDYDNYMLNSFIYFLINSVLHKDQIVEYAQSRIISYLYTSYWLMCSIYNRWEGNRNKCAYTSNLIVYIFR